MRSLQPLTYLNELPWKNLCYEVKEPKSFQDHVVDAKLGWEVDALPMYTELHDKVQGYHAIYRKDDLRIFGVVNKPYPKLIQNVNSFDFLTSKMSNELTLEHIGAINEGSGVFGVFNLAQQYKLIDDDIHQYLIVMNDHVAADGKLTIFNTPIRVVCSNSLAAALSASQYKFRVTLPDDPINYGDVAEKVLSMAGSSIIKLDARAKKMLSLKLSNKQQNAILDTLFPVTSSTELSEALGDDVINMQIELNRETFIHDCLGADNLSNYAGTFYQFFNAATDYSQHYYPKIDKTFDLSYRMKTLPGFGGDGSARFVDKLLKLEKIVA